MIMELRKTKQRLARGEELASSQKKCKRRRKHEDMGADITRQQTVRENERMMMELRKTKQRMAREEEVSFNQHKCKGKRKNLETMTMELCKTKQRLARVELAFDQQKCKRKRKHQETMMIRKTKQRLARKEELVSGQNKCKSAPMRMAKRPTRQQLARTEYHASNRKKCERVEHDDLGADLFSELPNHLICTIISRIPVNEAVATSVLSHRWRNVWKSITCVEFDPRIIRPCKIGLKKNQSRKKGGLNRFRNIDNKASPPKTLHSKSAMEKIDKKLVSSLGHASVTTCIITHLSGMEISNFLSKQTKLEKLSLTCVDAIKGMEIKRDILQHNKLSLLVLTNYRIRDGPIFDVCLTLKTLTLTKVVFVGYTGVFGKPLESCPFLENLVLDSCCEPGGNAIEIVVRSSTLKCLTLKNMGISMGEYKGYALIFSVECPNLTELRLDSHKHDYVRQSLQKGSGLVQESGGDKPIRDLRVLCTTMDLSNNRDLTVLAYVLDSWKNLCTIDITNKVDSTSTQGQLPYEHDLEFWEARELPRCITYQLRVVKIRGFCGDLQSIQFVSLVIRKASRLKQLVIECDETCSKIQAANTLELLEVQQAAFNVSMTLKPGKEYMSKFGDDFQKWMSTLN